MKRKGAKTRAETQTLTDAPIIIHHHHHQTTPNNNNITNSAESDYFGRTEVVELVPGGRELRVTDANKRRYVDLVARHRMTGSIKAQIKARCCWCCWCCWWCCWCRGGGERGVA